MTLTKTNIVKSLLDRLRIKRRQRVRQQFLFPEFDYEGLPKKRASELFETTFDIIKRQLEQGESVLLSGFGKFHVRFKWARKGRNPQTGETIVLKSRRVVTFQCSPKLKEKINNPHTE